MQRFGKTSHRELGGVVDARRASREERGHRGGVDHVATLLFAGLDAFHHARHEGHHPVDHTVEIDAHQPVPIVEGAFLDRLEQVDACIVAQDRDGAELGLHLVCRRLEAIAAGDIELDAHNLAVVEALEGLIDRILPDIGDGDLAALVQKLADQTDADAIGAAGDEGGASCEVLHAASPAVRVAFSASCRAISAVIAGLRNSIAKVPLYSAFSGRCVCTAAVVASPRSRTPSRNSL